MKNVNCFYSSNEALIDNFLVNNLEHLGKEWIVNPKKIHEYSNEFNKWLIKCLNNNIKIKLDGLSTDPGPGYYNEKENEWKTEIHQDIDDWFVLWIINKNCKNNSIMLCISDEIVDYNKYSFKDKKNDKIKTFIFLLPILLALIDNIFYKKEVSFLVIYLMFIFCLINFIINKNVKLEKYGYYGIREKFVNDEFGKKFNIIGSTVSKIVGFEIKDLPDYYHDKVKLTKNGPVLSEKSISHFRSFFGIFDGFDNDGYGILKDIDSRRNCFYEDQIKLDYSRLDSRYEKLLKLEYNYVTNDYIKYVLNHVKFLISRNKSGRGGTKNEIKDGVSGSLYNAKSKTEFYTKEGSMSNWHQFIIHNNPIIYWSNPYFFNNGPGIYGELGTKIFLYKMKELAEKWSEKNKIKKPFYGFHIFNKNSIDSLHCHCIDNDESEITYIDLNEKIKLPGYLNNINKTENLDNFLNY